MVWPRTDFEWDDQSYITTTVPEEDSVVRPIIMMGFTSEKGEEAYKEVYGKEFFKQYGDVIFAKHGQPLLQAARVITSGGRLFCKRVVAPDSKLANLGVVAKVQKIQVQKTDKVTGELLYLTPGGVETTDPVGNQPIMIDRCKISFDLKNINMNGNDFEGMAKTFLSNNAHTNAIGDDGAYPLFLIGDNGRGESKKKFRITPDSNAARPLEYTKNIFEVIEKDNVIETFTFSMNPNIIEKDKNISLENIIKEKSSQVRCKIFDDEIEAFMQNVTYIIGDKNQVFEFGDILFGTDASGRAIDGIIVDTSIVDLSNVYGLSLIGGSNGSFGTKPIASPIYDAEMVKVFNGEFDDEIYNLDNRRIDFIVDANYSANVKRAIEGFVTFREDCVYLRDLGIGLRSVAEINTANRNSLKNRFCASYHNSYDIIDPYTKKQVSVTIGYGLVAAVVRHYLNGITRPFAGIQYEVIFPEAIKGTVNFLPKHTPSYNQKEDLDLMRVNYASYYSDRLVMETEYTSQEIYTQLSFLNNVLAVQEIIKAVRERCPKIRYTFIDGDDDDLKKYQDDVQAVLNKFIGNFKSLTMKYVGDANYITNKIYYAAIEVKFKNFVQAEFFKITALQS